MLRSLPRIRPPHLAALLCWIGLIVMVLAGGPAAYGEPFFSFESPSAGLAVDSHFPVSVYIVASPAMKSVKARVDTREIDLTARPDTSVWRGDMDLTGLQKGEKTFEVIGVDEAGNKWSHQMSVVYDDLPVITVSAPSEESVTSDTLKVSASCTDDDPQGCASLRLYVLSPDHVDFFPQPHPPAALSGKDHIEGEISLQAYQGMNLELEFEARDTASRYTQAHKSVLVHVTAKPHSAFAEEAFVPGRIFDMEGNRILYVHAAPSGRSLRILDRATGGEETAMLIPDTMVPIDSDWSTFISDENKFEGYLTPRGAIFLKYESRGQEFGAADVYDWDGSVLSPLGGIMNSANVLRVKGSFATWWDNGGVVLRDLTRGVNTAEIKGGIDSDVTADGTLVYSKDDGSGTYQIYRWSSGEETQLTHEARKGANQYPYTDGASVVYVQYFPEGQTEPAFVTTLHHESAEEILSTNAINSPTSCLWEYRIENGWIAYTRADPQGHKQVWLRSPEGEDKQLSHSDGTSCIDALNPDGDVLFYTSVPYESARRFLAGFHRPSPVDLGSFFGFRSFWSDGAWHVLSGNTSFVLDPAALRNFGDVNEDGTVDVNDVIRLLKIITGSETITSEQKMNADVVRDDAVNVSDAVKILRVIVRLDPPFTD